MQQTCLEILLAYLSRACELGVRHGTHRPWSPKRISASGLPKQQVQGSEGVRREDQDVLHS